jgi:hypothetical protein
VRLIRRDQNRLLFHLGRREKDLLVQLLSNYPQTPPGSHKLSRQSKIEPGNQQMLDEALVEDQAEHKKQWLALLSDTARWTEHQQGWKLSLGEGEVEWLLQVLNDIRIGSWIRLGSPENIVEVVNAETAPHLWAMEIAGSFQMALLHVLESS